ncbi:hypothetical protein HZB96_04030 [Candidatus Gottesmanbacteria bacterium]|nr:hypothetical protein [Candidatus Gottesmanbacteria bacterium]
MISSHRLRAEEKKLFRKLVTTAVFLVLTVIIFIYAGIPLLVKIVVGISSLRGGGKQTEVATSTSLLFPPVLDPLAEATNSAKITVSGFADKEVTVKIYVNSKESVKVLTDKDGKFSAANVVLAEGTNIITATVVKENKESSPTAEISVSFKKSAPKLEISEPSEGQKFFSDSKDIAISGETDPGNRVTVNDRLAIVNPNGKFDFRVSLSSGDNTFKIVATDDAGNKTEMERKVVYNSQ